MGVLLIIIGICLLPAYGVGTIFIILGALCLMDQKK